MFVNLKTGDAAYLLSQDERGVYYSPDHIEESGNVYLLPSFDFFSTHREATRDEIEAGEPEPLRHGRRQLADRGARFDHDDDDPHAASGHRFAERGGQDDHPTARSTPPPNAATGARAGAETTPPASAAAAPSEPSKGAAATTPPKADNGKK